MNTTKEQLERLFEHTQKQWKILGEQEPYWSVLTQEKFKKENFYNNKDEFFATGRDIKNEFMRLVSKYDKAEETLIRNGKTTAFELGCGVGRLTAHLSDFYCNYTACDISQGNINEFNKNIDSRNVQTLLLNAVQEIEMINEFDDFFSFITLQHNAPPVQDYILKKIFQKMRKGGFAFFQTITHTEWYNFDIDKHLSEPANNMDMHRLYMHEIINAMEVNGLKPLEVHADCHGDKNNNSYTFFAQKVR